jgi:hypothetical protein
MGEYHRLGKKEEDALNKAGRCYPIYRLTAAAKVLSTSSLTPSHPHPTTLTHSRPLLPPSSPTISSKAGQRNDDDLFLYCRGRSGQTAYEGEWVVNTAIGKDSVSENDQMRKTAGDSHKWRVMKKSRSTSGSSGGSRSNSTEKVRRMHPC